MSSNSRVIFRLAFGVLAILPQVAIAQSPSKDSRDNTWAVLDVVATINSAIDESSDGPVLRERTVRRLAECALAYGGLSTLTSNADAKKNYVQAQLATSDVEALIGKPLEKAVRLGLEETAQKSVALLLRGVKSQGDKQIGPLIKNCRALNNVTEIKNALQELPPR